MTVFIVLVLTALKTTCLNLVMAAVDQPLLWAVVKKNDFISGLWCVWFIYIYFFLHEKVKCMT